MRFDVLTLFPEIFQGYLTQSLLKLALVVIDTVIRLVPGVLGDEASAVEESHSEPGRVEYPQYTRPRVFRGMEVPDILLSGNHPAIARWRQKQSTARSRPSEQPTISEGESNEK